MRGTNHLFQMNQVKQQINYMREGEEFLVDATKMMVTLTHSIFGGCH